MLTHKLALNYGTPRLTKIQHELPTLMKINKKRLPAFIALLITITSIVPAQGRRPTAKEARTARPKLVLAIIVDQFRYDFLERFDDLFVEGGLRKLMNNGAFFTNANYDYVPTYTAPGHAAIFTGSTPALNGIVGNEWFDRETGKRRVMVSDPNARIVKSPAPEFEGAAEQASRAQSAPMAGSGGGVSPRSLIGSTIGDQLRLATSFTSKVITASFKDRSAILPGGKRPNGAFWFDAATGTFVSSDYYGKELPAWVNKFNSAVRPDKYFGAKWERLLPDSAYKRSQSSNLEVQRSGLGKQFPYTITGGADKPNARFYGAFESTPFALDYLADFARAAIEGESLGADGYPDLLSISFSATDLIGHAYGPDSQEVEDAYLRLDHTIEGLLNYIDKAVGLKNTIVFMTGDHGVSPVPEYLSSNGIDAGRVNPKEIMDSVNQALTARFGGSGWVQALVNDQIYLDKKVIAERKADPEEAEKTAGEASLKTPAIVNYYTRSQIIDGRMPPGPISRRVMNGFNRTRSGDVWLIAKPFYLMSEGVALGTTHHSAYGYDTHVPVILFGWGVRSGRYNFECSPSDIAPTLAALLRIEMPPNRTGRVLVEAIQ